MEKGQMTKSFIWKESSNEENFQFSNTHVFNLFVMEKKERKSVCSPPPTISSKKKKKLNRRWNFFLKEIIKVVLLPNAPLSLL
jgi:hypothetical protein